jgi:hypothetical protein
LRFGADSSKVRSLRERSRRISGKLFMSAHRLIAKYRQLAPSMRDAFACCAKETRDRAG